MILTEKCGHRCNARPPWTARLLRPLRCVGWMAMAVLAAVALPCAAAADLPAPADWPVPDPAPATPGPDYAPPIDRATAVAEEAPRVYEHSDDAGPDQSFFIVGEGLTPRVFVWGRSAASAEGQAWEVKTPLAEANYVTATLPERACDAVFLAWFGNDAGWSRPLRLNVPQPWWYWPREPAAGSKLRIFGRDLARRPDRTTAFLYLARPGEPGRWLEVERAEKYTVTAQLPADLDPGAYQLWLHAGSGGAFGWSEPLAVRVVPGEENEGAIIDLAPPVEADGADVDLNQRLEEVAAGGGGTLRLAAGVYPFRGTIRVPGGVRLVGAGREATRLQLVQSEPHEFAPIGRIGWNRAPSGIHTPGDTMEYRVHFPAAGRWTVWQRYATDMSPWGHEGVSGNMTLEIDGSDPVALEDLANTGSFGTYRWSRSAEMTLAAGEQTLRWRNVQGGGISLDAFVFALDPDYQPSDRPWPESGDGVVVVQAEDVARFAARDGSLPSGVRAAVWLAGDGAALEDLTVSGTPQVNHGVVVTHPEPLGWVRRCRIENVRVADLEGKDFDTSAVRLIGAESAVVRNNELWGRTPLYLSGVRDGDLSHNRLVPATRFGGNSEAAIQGRNEVIERCIVEGNIVGSPPGAEAGGPQTRRLIWVSTGRGSVTHNWFAHNGVPAPNGPGAAAGAGPMRFGGVAGTDQNVGEMILFEAQHRTMYFGPLAEACQESVTLPETLPPTPDARLGTVARELLAHDEQGNETPFWPPHEWDESPEPPQGEYYVTVFQGPGQGQTRRVVRREGTQLRLDRPWRTAPAEGSIVAVGTAFYRNLIVGNHTADGMTGIQLWISCIENVIAGNSIARQRKPALFLYANGTTLASSMPRTWNRGISPLFFNHVEGNWAEECSTGALVTSGDYPDMPIEFPRALGNALRQNSFHRSRGDGVVLVSRSIDPAAGDTSASILGTLVEFNVVRDALTGYRAGPGSDGVLFRRNHAYFWYPVGRDTELPVAFRVDVPGARVAMEDNSIEGKSGVLNPREVIPLRETEE